MTSNFTLIRLCRNIPDFKGVFMRDELRGRRPAYRKKAIINLDSRRGRGTHWTCYRKRGDKVSYFDPFGSLPPPQELMEYWGRGVQVTYNRRRYQSYDLKKCGYLCVRFLKNQL